MESAAESLGMEVREGVFHKKNKKKRNGKLRKKKKRNGKLRKKKKKNGKLRKKKKKRVSSMEKVDMKQGIGRRSGRWGG